MKRNEEPKAEELKVHPAADIFPMMSEGELADLADDIKANGLIHPIIVDAENQLIDGRNRYAACRIAGINPTVEKLNGRDPLAFIASANLQRRNLTKGQQAMAMARLYPVPERGRGKKDPAKKDADSAPFSYRRVQEARQVLAASPQYAQQVIDNTLSLDDALKKVEVERIRADGVAAQMERLRKGAPDLADLVAEERMSLSEATAAWTEREAVMRRLRQAGRSSAESILGFAGQVSDIVSAVDAGEDIQIASDKLRTLETALQLLIRTVERKETKAE